MRYRGIDGRGVILLHTADLQRLNLEDEERVVVTSRTGSLPNVRVKRYDSIKPGNALMYFPEANALVDRRADPASKTPSFKCTCLRPHLKGKLLVTVMDQRSERCWSDARLVR